MILRTHEAIENLKNVGATQELAEAIVELHTKSDEQLVTKNDIIRLESKIENLGVKLESKIDSIETRLQSKIDGIATRSESSIRELNNNNSWVKLVAITNFSAILCALIAYFFK